MSDKKEKTLSRKPNKDPESNAKMARVTKKNYRGKSLEETVEIVVEATSTIVQQLHKIISTHKTDLGQKHYALQQLQMAKNILLDIKRSKKEDIQTQSNNVYVLNANNPQMLNQNSNLESIFKGLLEGSQKVNSEEEAINESQLPADVDDSGKTETTS